MNEIISKKNEVSMFSAIDAGIQELKDAAGSLPTVIKNEEDHKVLKAGLRDFVAVRKNLEECRVTLKKPHLDAGRLIDEEAKKVKAQIDEIEAPLKRSKKRYDDDIKRRKEGRANAIAAAVLDINQSAAGSIGKDAEWIDKVEQHIESYRDDRYFSPGGDIECAMLSAMSQLAVLRSMIVSPVADDVRVEPDLSLPHGFMHGVVEWAEANYISTESVAELEEIIKKWWPHEES